VSLNDWILSLHELSAFALVASMVLFWILVVATRSLTDIDQRITFGRIGDFGGRVIGVGFVGTIVLGLWLSFSRDDYAPWDRLDRGGDHPVGDRRCDRRARGSRVPEEAGARTGAQVVRPGGAAR
jgi:hypothetical protein